MKQLDLDLDLELCKDRADRAARMAKKASKDGDNEDLEYWTNSRNDWLQMVRELESEGNAEQDND